MLVSIGDLVEDVVAHLRADPRKGTDTPTQVFRRRGGSAANVAAFAAQDNTPVRFVGQVGDDPLGRRLAAELGDCGVDTRVTHQGSTGSIIVLVDSRGERTFLTDRGASVQLAITADDVLDGADVLHVPVYSLVTDPLARTTSRLIGDASELGCAITIDLSSTAMIEEFGPAELRAFLETVQPATVFANDDEHGALGYEVGAPIRGAGTTIVKQGADPTLIVSAKGDVMEVPVKSLEVVDTTGAGDAFAAGYLGALLDGSSPRVAVDRAHKLAARCVQAPGATLTA